MSKVETRSQEFARLVATYQMGEVQSRREAWEQIAEFAVDNAEFIRDALLAYVAPAPDEGPDLCEVCGQPLTPADICATDIDMGTCHAACLEGTSVVDMETGEPLNGKPDTFRYGEDVPAGIGFADLRNANLERQTLWCPDQVPDLSFRGNELGGECGEALNVIKKLERERLGWRGSRDTVDHLAEELADVVICADLVAITAGVDLGAAVLRKFNATSDKVGISVKLGLPEGR